MNKKQVKTIKKAIQEEQDIELLMCIANAINHDSVAKWRKSQGLYRNPNKSISTENWDKAIAIAHSDKKEVPA